MEDIKKKQVECCQNLLNLLQSGFDNDTLLSEIELLSDIGCNGLFMNILYQLKALLGQEIGPEYEWKDTMPELDEEQKKGIIAKELKACLNQEEIKHEKIFERVTRQISFNGEKVKVEELLREPWCYILYKAVGAEWYYLFLTKSQSSASWSVMHKLSKQQGETFLSNPNYDNARSVAVDAEVEQKP